MHPNLDTRRELIEQLKKAHTPNECWRLIQNSRAALIEALERMD